MGKRHQTKELSTQKSRTSFLLEDSIRWRWRRRCPSIGCINAGELELSTQPGSEADADLDLLHSSMLGFQMGWSCGVVSSLLFPPSLASSLRLVVLPSFPPSDSFSFTSSHRSIINIVLGMNGVWFAAVFDQTRMYFEITTNQVRRLSRRLG